MAKLEGRELGGAVILDEFSGECSLSDVARNELTGILLQCLDSDDKKRSLAEAKIVDLENFGWFGLALTIFTCTKQIEYSGGYVRVVAGTVLRKHLARKWSRGVISEQIGQLIKIALLNGSINETDRRVVTQLNLCLRIILRDAWPLKWKDPFPWLLHHVQDEANGSMLRQRRALQAVTALLDELKSCRLPTQKQNIHRLAHEIVGQVFTTWQKFLQRLIRGLSPDLGPQDQQYMCESMECFLACTKSLALLLQCGWSDKNLFEEPNTRKYLEVFCSSNVFADLLHLNSTIQGWSWTTRELNAENSVLPFALSLKKCLRWMFRAIHETQLSKPLSFVEFIRPALEKTYGYIFSFVNSRSTLIHTYDSPGSDEKLGVLYIQFMLNVLNCSAYGIEEKESEKANPIGVSHTHTGISSSNGCMPSMFFTHERITQLVSLIVHRGLALTQDQLDLWTENPEDFAVEETEGANTSTSFRPACEYLLTTLTSCFSSDVVPLLIEIEDRAFTNLSSTISATSSIHSDGIPDSVVDYESALLSVGLCTYWLHNRFPFKSFIERRLFFILGQKEDKEGGVLSGLSLDVLRRRVLWVLGCIAGEFGKELHAPLYSYLLGLMESPQACLLVRIAAVKSFSSLIESYEFDLDQFCPVASRSVRSLLNLMSECESSSMRMTFMNTVTSIVDRVQGTVDIGLIGCIQPLKTLWLDSIGHDWSLWKILTLRMLERGVESISESVDMGYDEKNYQISHFTSMLLPLLAICLDPSSPDFIYLGEPAIKLWAILMKSSVEYSEQMHSYFRLLTSVTLSSEIEVLESVAEVIEAYVMFSCNSVLRDYGEAILLPFFERLLPDSKSALPAKEVANEKSITKLFELLLRTRSSFMFPLFGNFLVRVKQVVCASSSETNPEFPLVVPCLSLLARAVVEYGSAVLPESHLPGLVDSLINMFNHIKTSPMAIWRRKLWVMALLILTVDCLAKDETLLRTRFSVVLDLWQNVHADLYTPEQNTAALENVIGKQSRHESLSPGQKLNFFQKKQQLFLGDLVFSQDLKVMLQESVLRCESLVPPGLLRSIVENDPPMKAVLSQLGSLN